MAAFLAEYARGRALGVQPAVPLISGSGSVVSPPAANRATGKGKPAKSPNAPTGDALLRLMKRKTP